MRSILGRWWVLVLALMLLAGQAVADGLQATRVSFGGIPDYFYVTVSKRPGVTQGFLLLERSHAKASVILFVGGDGFIQITPDGMGPFLQGNFLQRMRDLLAAQGFRVAIVDTPSDRPNLVGFRATPEHAQDITGVIQYLRWGSPAPVWVIGTSRGTISVAGVASQLHGRAGPDGAVFTSSLLRPGGNPHTVFDADLSAINVPTLVVHHVDDGCFVTQFSDVHLLTEALIHARDLQLLPISGGTPTSVLTGLDPCGGSHHHGYIGQEASVVAAIGHYILAHSRPGRGRGWQEGRDR